MPQTKIEWASHTWNPYSWNCTKVSQGCKNCYAENRSLRYKGHASNGNNFLKFPPIVRENAWKELKKFEAGSVIFVNSHSDTYHEAVPLETIQRVHQTAADHPHLTFLLLTKRIRRAYEMQRDLIYTDNLWIGTSIEDNLTLHRLDYLMDIPSAGHFLSAEPLLAEISIRRSLATGKLNWVIVGGESGKGFRPFNHDWARTLRDECQEFDTPFLFKQGSAYQSGQDRILDGRTWDETPFRTDIPVTYVEEQPQQIKLL